MNDATDLGAALLVEPSRALPLVQLSIAERTGALEDPADKDGLSRFVARLMRRTGGNRKAQELDSAFDSLGGSFGADVSHSTVTFHGAVISRNLDAFVDLVCDVLARPSFADDELGRLRRESEAEIVESRDNDRALAQRWFQRNMFAGHAYGRSISGKIAFIRGFDGADVRGLYQTTLCAENLLIGLSGDIDETRARAVTDRILGALPKGQRRRDALSDPAGPQGRKLVIVDKPERTQTQILIGTLGTHPHDPDHIALHVANTVLGGTFTARLMKEIRSKRGWSYGAYSNLPYDRHRQAFSMWTFPKASDAAQCIGVELGMLRAWREKGVTKRELAWAKRFLTRSHAFAIDTAAKRLGLRLDAVLYDLPPGYYEEYLEHVRAVTLEDVNRAIQTRIDDRNLIFSVVGSESEIGDAVKAAIPDLAASEVVPFDRD